MLWHFSLLNPPKIASPKLSLWQVGLFGVAGTTIVCKSVWGFSGYSTPQLDDDPRIGDEFLGHYRLFRVGLRIFEIVLQLAPVDTARPIDLIQRQVETFFPPRAVLGIGPGQRTAYAQVDGLMDSPLIGQETQLSFLSCWLL